MYFSQKRVSTNRCEDLAKLPQSISHAFLVRCLQIHKKERISNFVFLTFSKLEIIL